MNLDEELREKIREDIIEDSGDKVEKIGQNQFYDIITSRKPDWQAIIYDLIHTEQLDPWDIDIIILTEKYFEKVLELEKEIADSDELEVTDFYASSKVLLAAALLLRIKSEFLLNRHIKSIDDILFGKKEDKKYFLERIEIDNEDLPILIPKTPLPRARRVTLDELMSALNHAINTESRRIKREVSIKRAQKLSEVDFPEFSRIDLKDRIKHFYARVLTSLKKKAVTPEKHMNKIGYCDLIGKEREEKLASFLPLLHLSNTQKLWLEQEKHLDEIWVYLYNYFNKNKDKFMEDLEKDIEDMKEELAEESTEKFIEESDEGEDYEAEIKGRKINPWADEDAKEISNLFSGIFEEINNLNKEEKIEEITGFEDELE
jgi:chromatin segregation and condensation protein Rec8/ScpA/Scc1 (kleisin family)